jgi:hypothetical protein
MDRVANDYARLAEALVQWLRTRPGVTDVEQVELTAPHRAGRPALPKPSFLKLQVPDFVIRFNYKGEQRNFRYIIEHKDELTSLLSTLRVHTNGELMVRVPNAVGRLEPNDIYYRNRSSFAPGVGDPAPNMRSR